MRSTNSLETDMETGKEKITCPYCGYAMPIYRTESALSRGIYVRCKARHCRRIFEVKIEPKRPEKR